MQCLKLGFDLCLLSEETDKSNALYLFFSLKEACMKKVKLVVAEKFIGKRNLEDVLLSAFQTELSMLKNDELSVIMKSTKQSQDSFCSGKELRNGTNE